MRIGELLKESLGKFELDYEAVTYFTRIKKHQSTSQPEIGRVTDRMAETA